MNNINYTNCGALLSWFIHHKVLVKISTILISVMLAIVPFLGIQPAEAQSVGISSSSGQPGTDVTISGSSFTNGDTYQIIFAPGTAFEQLLAPATIISGTSFSRAVIVPQVPYHQYNIRVSSSRGNFTLLFQILPVIELNTTSGFVGDDLLISGAGFNADRTVTVYLDSHKVATTTSNANGVLDPLDFQIPALRGQSYALYLRDGTVNSPVVVFTIIPRLIASASQGFVGDQVNLNGTGFDDNSRVKIYWNDQLIVNSGVSTNASGSFATTITIPPSVRANYSIMVIDNTSTSDTVTFTVNPKIIISPNIGTSGTNISITGNGFRGGATISFSYNAVTIAGQPQFNTDQAGSFSGNIVIPGILAGSYTLRASDGLYAATAAITIASKIELSVSTGSVGTEVIAYGAGFTANGRVTINYDNQTVVNITADNTGAFSATFTVPSSAAGSHTITASDVTSETITASAVFTMEEVPPPVPSLLVPQNSSQTDVMPAFSWSPVTDPSGVTYELQVARDAKFTQPVLFKQGLTLNEYRVSQSEQLQLTKSDKPYYWRVRAIDGAGNTGGWTNAGSFYTQDSTPPDVLITFGPKDQSQADLQPVFSWSAVTDPNGITYELQIAWDANFGQLVLLKQGMTGTEYQLVQSEALSLTKKQAPYYWRVRAVDGVQNAGEWSATNSFYTQDSTPPPVPGLLSPADGSKNGKSILFDWTDVNDTGKVTYILDVAEDTAFTHVLIHQQGLSTSEYQLTKAEELNSTPTNPPGSYYWRVRAIDTDQNMSDWSSVNAFSVSGFSLSGWPMYAIAIIGGILLLAIGIFIGTRIGRGRKTAL
jgi:hypothetical protein